MTTAMITSVDDNLEIRCPERGRKRFCTCDSTSNHSLFGNKMPREGTETCHQILGCGNTQLSIWK